MDRWSLEASKILRAEIKRGGLTYKQFAVRLKNIKVAETESSLRNKFSRGTFSFAFVLQCMHALGKTTLDVSVPGTPSPEKKSGAVPKPVAGVATKPKVP